MKNLVIFLLLTLSNSLYAQVEILAEQDQDRNLTLMAFNKDVIPHTIRIEFSKLENLESKEGNILFKVAKPGKSILLKLQSIYVNEPTGFNYRTQVFKGDFQLATPILPTYLVPVKEGTILSVRPLSAQQRQNASNEPFVGVGFFFEKTEIVCAPRKGIIADIKMNSENINPGPADFESENYIEIYHQDGTFSRLSGLKANSARVNIGEIVFPGQELAESSPLPNQQNHHVKMIQSKWEMNENGIIWLNFPVPIFTDQEMITTDQPIGKLISKHPNELVIKEMDKKELKRFSDK